MWSWTSEQYAAYRNVHFQMTSSDVAIQNGQTEAKFVQFLLAWKKQDKRLTTESYKNSSGDEIANVNFFTTTSYLYRPAPTPIEPTSQYRL